MDTDQVTTQMDSSTNSYEYTALKCNNSGYIETTLKVNNVLLTSPASPVRITIRFSDFGVGVLLPSDNKHYVATTPTTLQP